MNNLLVNLRKNTGWEELRRILLEEKEAYEGQAISIERSSELSPDRALMQIRILRGKIDFIIHIINLVEQDNG